MNEDFFVKPESEKTAILLIDASGSVLETFSDKQTVFDKMLEICTGLPHEQFYVLFWNSDNHYKTKFEKSGVLRFPFAQTKEKLPLAFKAAASCIDQFCLTMPHLALSQIDAGEKGWLKTGVSRTIYFVTDGQMGWSAINAYEKKTLADALARNIKSLLATYRDVQLNIFAVERNSAINYAALECTTQVVGSDVYNVISTNALTQSICRFTSYTPRHLTGYNHIDKVQTPKGFVPYGRRYFSVLATHQFMNYMAQLVAANKGDEDALLKIVQDLAASLSVLTHDKPARARAQTVNMFCRMFEGTALDSSMAQFLLTRGVAADAEGSAQLYAEYRANLKNLYANAGKMLHDNAAQAMAIADRTLTLPLSIGGTGGAAKRVILLAHARTPDQEVCGHKNGGYLLDKKLVPVVPFVSPHAGLMTKQCVRQWLRLLLSYEYGTHSTSDENIFIMMTLNLATRLAGIAAPVCEAYTNLCTALLEKKRLNTQSTEIEQLLAGNLFVPNDGNVDAFVAYLRRAVQRLNLPSTAEPLQLWYYMCLAHSQRLADSQFIHCQQFVKAGATLDDVKEWAATMPPLSLYQVPEELEFVCLITHESTRNTGGWRFLSHKTAFNDECRPRQVLSVDGFQQLLAQRAASLCPVCYAPLSKDDFEYVAPVANAPASASGNSNDFDASQLCTDKYASGVSSHVVPINLAAPAAASSSSTARASSAAASATKPFAQGTPGTLYVLQGVVGSGKTTYAKDVERQATAKGHSCIVEGVDKYVFQGMSFPEAIGRVTRALIEAQQSTEANKIVIIDTCGENFNVKKVFDVDFSNWNVVKVWVNLDRKRLRQYLAWSLRNVVRRGTDDAVLTPGRASLGKCIDVHLRKAKAHFGKQTAPLAPNTISQDALLQQLENDANEYEKFLADNKETYAAKL
jgi:hypothetical protein